MRARKIIQNVFREKEKVAPKRKREDPQRENFLAGFGCKKINGQEISHPLPLSKNRTK